MTASVVEEVGADRAIASIERMVLSREVRPGDRLPNERELALKFSVSRGSVREAIRTLAAQGVLEARVGAGTFVTSLDPAALLGSAQFGITLLREQRVPELLEIRRALDAIAARSAVDHLTARDHAQLRLLIEVMCSDAAVDDRIQADAEFHRLIAQRGANSVVAALLDAFAVDIEPARVRRASTDQDAARAMREEHLAIADALRLGDADEAAKAAELHVSGLIDWLSIHEDLPNPG